MLYLNTHPPPFIILGDFNEISCELDKLGGATFNSSRLSVMNMLFSQTPCIEVPFEGSRKKRVGFIIF